MKKIFTTLTVLALTLVLTGTVMAKNNDKAKGPWVAKVEGNGYLSGGSLSTFDVDETNLGWNFKVNSEDKYNGNLNIVEKQDGKMFRHFKLSGDQVTTAFYSCVTHEMRVEGKNDEGQTVAAHFRGWRNTQFPNSIWYWVKNDSGVLITNTNARLTLDMPFFVLCDEDKVLMETLTVDAIDVDGVNSASLFDGMKYQFKVTGTANAGDTIDFDAKYSITNRISGDTWTDMVSGYESYGPELLDLFVNGTYVDWGAYNEDHTYFMDYMGDGNAVNFKIHDIHYPNNTGNLNVEIYLIP